MKSSPRSVGVMLAVGVAVALALTEYGSAGALAPATRVVSAAAKKKETKAQKLAKALRACKKDRPKSKRKACEKKAGKLYGAKKPSGGKPRSKTGTGTTGTGTGTTATTGTGATEGATTGTGTGIVPTTGATTAGNMAEELEKARHVSQMPTAGAIEQGRALFAQDCSGCHGPKGEGQSGDDFVAYANLPRAQSVTGVIEQLIEPDGGMPTFGALPFEQKEEIGDYLCVVLTAKCGEAH